VLANSDEVKTSLPTVATAIESFSPLPKVRLAFFFDFSAFSKKYLALFLCNMSRIVPPTTIKNMSTMYPFMIEGEITAESSAKGLTSNIIKDFR